MIEKQTANFNTWLEKYTKNLTEDITKNPSQWATKVEDAPQLALKMSLSLQQGGANISTTIKRTARQLGVSQTAKGIKEFLND